MRKTLIGISVVALIIVMVSAVIALVSVLNLSQHIPGEKNIGEQPEVGDQAIILVAYVDDLSQKQFLVENLQFLYLVTSRMDTAIIQDHQQGEINLLFPSERKMTENGLIRFVESESNINIDYYLLFDRQSEEHINILLENQQSSINLNNSEAFCEILFSDKYMQLLSQYLIEPDEHLRSTLPENLIEQLIVNENPKDSIYCESIQN